LNVRLSLPLIALVTLLVIGFVPACGSGNGGSSSPPPSTEPPPAVNPCLAAADTVGEEEVQPEVNETETAAAKRQARGLDGDPRGRVYDSLWLHASASATRPLFAPPQQTATEDVGEIAVLQDAGDLLVAPNAFDLRGVGLRFDRSGAGYEVTRTNAQFRSNIGTRLQLQDDDSRAFTLPFGFPFYAATQSRAFVNSDGNVTFEQEDKASTDRNVSRIMTGPPRVAPFFADLDPSTGNGRVFVQSDADAFTVTWCTVRGFDKSQTVTVQTSLFADGAVEVKFGDAIDLGEAVVALSPGHTGQFTALDLSTAGPLTAGAVALGERFALTTELDLVATAQKFYRTHPDNYDQLVIWTDVSVVNDAFAFETTVANEIRGIGIDIYDQARAFGSAGRLRSMVMMDALGKYPANPQTRFLGENNTLSLVGQESGHRWLAFLEFRDHNGQTSDELLGRDRAHWSFFMDSEASVMEGNDIEDLGGGTFRTRDAVRRYSLLDQYAMGLVTESQVPSFFYVENPTNVIPAKGREDGPQIGVRFNGTKRTVLLQDIVAVMGPRQPAAGSGSRVHRQAFVYVLSSGRTTDPNEVQKVDTIRRGWETFFRNAVGGRARAETRLRPPS